MPTSGTRSTDRADLGEAFHEYMYEADGFIGGQAFGLLDVQKKNATLTKMRRESLLRVPDSAKLAHAPKSKFNRDDFDHEDLEYNCKDYGHEIQLSREEIEFFANDFDSLATANEVAWFRLMAALDQRVAAILFDGSTNFTTGNGRRTDVAAAWGTASTDIIGDVQTAKEAVRGRTGVEPNTLVIGAGVVPFFLKNDGMRDAIKHTEMASIEAIKNALSALLGLDRILIGKGVTNTAKEGQAATVTDIWSNIWASVCVTAPAGSPLFTPSVGRTALWTPMSPGIAQVEEYDEPQTDSVVIRSRHYTDELLCDVDFAQLLDIAA